MPKQTTGEFMATLRKANGYTQQDVAEKLNISNRTLSSWETDRTLPDVLMLPAIADLYGVTVDELLRGERSNGEKITNISEDSLKNVYKNKFGSFLSKSALLLVLTLLGAALFILGCMFALWTLAPAWLDWALLILGIVELCVCIAIITYLYCNVRFSVGAILDEDLTDDKKAFITALRNKLENYLLICALPFALFASIILIYYIVVNPQGNSAMIFGVRVKYFYKMFISLNYAFAAVLFFAYLILKVITVKKYYSDTQKTIAKTNRKLIGRLAAFSAIPIAVVMLLNIVLSMIFPTGYKVLYKNGDFDAFKTHMHTLIVDDGEGVPSGEYYLPLPDELPENGTEYDLGNGFYGVYHCTDFSAPSILIISEAYWEITYGKEGEIIFENEEYVFHAPVPTWVFYVYKLGNNYVANVRYYLEDHIYDYFGNRIEVSIGQNKKTFCLMTDITDTLTDVAIYTFTIVPICTVVTCAVIYSARRKKQKYDF